MDFNTYLNNAWNDHAHDANAVAHNFGQGLTLAQTTDQLSQLARLGTHVYSEHLGRWNDGIIFLNQIKTQTSYSAESTGSQMKIYEASLALSSQPNTKISSFTVSEQIRILGMSASAMSEQGQPEKAKSYFLKALDLAKSGLEATDPANRSLAITGNNLATSLEEKKERTPQETELMILSAQIGRQFWEIAGTWKETERAEYRLSKTYLQASNYDKSFSHARNCIEICEKNGAPAIEFFFGYEAIALAERARGQKVRYEFAVGQMKKYLNEVPENEKPWCQSALEKI